MVWFRRTRNLKRRIIRKSIGFVHVTLQGKLPVVREPVPFVQKQVFDQPAFSIWELREYSLRILDSGRSSGLLLQLSSFEGGGATYDSLIDIIKLWQEYDKPVWIYSNNYSMYSYYLACHADKIFLPKGGNLYTTGLNLTSSFLHSYFKDKGIEMQVAQVSKYKSAANSLAYDDMPEEQRENLNWLADGIYTRFLELVAKNRDMNEDQVEEMVNSSPKCDLDALEGGFIDDIQSASQIAHQIENEFGTELIELEEAIGRLPIPKSGRGNIAVIPVIGNIIDGKSQNNPIPIPLLGGRSSGDETIAQYIRAVKEEKRFKAAILYVNSGGGSATASEVMLQEMKELAKKIPVVVYFHDVAASGGYYIAMGSSAIIAQPLTLTASIGVLNAKISTDGFYEKRDINRVTIKRGKNATIISAVGTWDEDQRETIEKNMNRTYDIFQDYVKENRDIDQDQLDEVNGGRVFFGHQVIDKGLIDELGGINVAIDRAITLADMKKGVIEVIGDQKKIRAPDSIIDPDMVIKQLSDISGKNQLVPYFKIDIQT